MQCAAAAKFNSSKGTTRETAWVSQSTGPANATCVISVMTDAWVKILYITSYCWCWQDIAAKQLLLEQGLGAHPIPSLHYRTNHTPLSPAKLHGKMPIRANLWPLWANQLLYVLFCRQDRKKKSLNKFRPWRKLQPGSRNMHDDILVGQWLLPLKVDGNEK